MSEYGDLVAAALRADADAERERLRAAGITCPSCGKNAADLTGIGQGHRLEMITTGEPGPDCVLEAQCGDGRRVRLDGFAAAQNTALTSVLDDFWQQFDEAMRQAIGTGPASFTGLLDVLNAEGGT